MATTTNYGWTTPDDTALVKDGAAAIRTLGSSIDSTLKTQIDAQIPDALLTTKGDIIAATGASTPARLGVGANDTVLIADSTTATGLKWGTAAAGGMTLLSTTTLSGTSTTISSISQSYKNLYILVNNYYSSTASRFRLMPNNQNGNAQISGVYGTGSIAGSTNIDSQSNSGTTSNTTDGNFAIIINNYAQTSLKPLQFYGYSDRSLNSLAQNFAGASLSSSAITSIVITSTAGTATINGTAYIYGVN